MLLTLSVVAHKMAQRETWCNGSRELIAAATKVGALRSLRLCLTRAASACRKMTTKRV
jgi:hypothetical protein